MRERRDGGYDPRGAFPAAPAGTRASGGGGAFEPPRHFQGGGGLNNPPAPVHMVACGVVGTRGGVAEPAPRLCPELVLRHTAGSNPARDHLILKTAAGIEKRRLTSPISSNARVRLPAPRPCDYGDGCPDCRTAAGWQRLFRWGRRIS